MSLGLEGESVGDGVGSTTRGLDLAWEYGGDGLGEDWKSSGALESGVSGS